MLKDPALVDRLGGNLARQAQLVLIDKFCGKNLLYRESLPRKLELLRADLAGPNPTPLERLLAERVVACWLHLHHLEAIYYGTDGMALELARHYQRCISQAQRRYLAAVKTLAAVRKLALPVLQVNVAESQQINVGAPPAGGRGG